LFSPSQPILVCYQEGFSDQTGLHGREESPFELTASLIGYTLWGRVAQPRGNSPGDEGREVATVVVRVSAPYGESESLSGSPTLLLADAVRLALIE
jgi:hypothetical protein